MVKHSTDPTPAFAPTHDRMPAWKRAAAALTIGATGMFLATGCAPSERANPPASASETPGATPSETQNTAGEIIGQDTEIAYNQLTIMEQETSIEDMAAMSVDDYANLDIPDRAAYGYYLVHQIMGENELAWNVGEVGADQVSFYSEGSIRSGNALLSAHEEQIKALVGSGLSEDDGRKLKLAKEYSATVGGVVPATTKSEMEKYAHLTQVDTIQIIPRGVSEIDDGKPKESGWVKVKDGAGRDQWIKVINSVSHDDNDTVIQDQTIQYVRVTVKLPDGKEVFWYAEGNAADGNNVTELASESIK